jgi:hypothetical protein
MNKNNLNLIEQNYKFLKNLIVNLFLEYRRQSYLLFRVINFSYFKAIFPIKCCFNFWKECFIEL